MLLTCFWLYNYFICPTCLLSQRCYMFSWLLRFDLLTGYPTEGLCDCWYWIMVFLYMGFKSCFQAKLYLIFDWFSRVRKILTSYYHLGLVIHFSYEFWFRYMPCVFLGDFGKSRPTLGQAMVATCTTFESERDSNRMVCSAGPSLYTVLEWSSESFMAHYKHIVDATPDRLSLQDLEQRSTESFNEYAQRWWDLTTQVQSPLTERETIMLLWTPYMLHTLRHEFQQFGDHKQDD